MNFQKRRSFFYPLVGLLVLVILALSWRFWTARAAKNNHRFSFAKVERGAFEKKVSVSGQIDADKKAVLKFKTSGKLAWVGVQEGDFVKKWQAIASLDQRELKKKFQKEMNDYLTTRWKWEQTQADYKDYRDRLLLTDEMKRILDESQFGLDNAVLDLEIADLAVKYATIYSPIAGIVTEVDSPLAGVNITPATAKFVVVDPDSVYFSAKVDELDVGKVKVGQAVVIVLDAYPGERFDGRVTNVAFSAVSTSGGGKAFLTKVSLPSNNNLKFKLGMRGDAEILVVRKKNVLSVPVDALIKRKKDSVWTVDDQGRARRKEVLTGLESEDRVEVAKGLSEGERVIIKGLVGLKEGQKVR